MSETGMQRIVRIADSLKAGVNVSPETVRTLLSWFGAKRRGYLVADEIRHALNTAGILTEPDFEDVFIDALLFFKQAPSLSTPNAAPVVVNLETNAALPSGGVVNTDASFRISKLEAANSAPVRVAPDATLAEAVTIMMSREFSQLPVMQNERDVKGVISWKSIGSRLAAQQGGTFVREFMDSHREIDARASLFEVIRVVSENGYVLVRASDRKIAGIVTSSDLSDQFLSLTEPFLLLAEIENELRRVLDAKFSAEQLATARDPNDTARVISSAHDMTFGEYVRLLESSSNWVLFADKIDRSVFIRELKEMRLIRNDVMHFDADGIDPAALQKLRSFAKFMQRLRELGVT